MVLEGDAYETLSIPREDRNVVFSKTLDYIWISILKIKYMIHNIWLLLKFYYSISFENKKITKNKVTCETSNIAMQLHEKPYPFS